MSPSLVTKLASAALLAAMLTQTATAASPQKLAKRYVGSDFETEFSALPSRSRCHSQSRKKITDGTAFSDHLAQTTLTTLILQTVRRAAFLSLDSFTQSTSLISH